MRFLPDNWTPAPGETAAIRAKVVAGARLAPAKHGVAKAAKIGERAAIDVLGAIPNPMRCEDRANMGFDLVDTGLVEEFGMGPYAEALDPFMPLFQCTALFAFLDNLCLLDTPPAGGEH